MFGILVRIFIENPENTSDFAVREKYGILCGVLGLFFNLLLFIFKLIVGIVTRSVAVTGQLLIIFTRFDGLLLPHCGI
ncbi:hypothetical protein [Treponema parvum]|uniref:hypothetical protein n=1 Tax=Treponema parvum TaxID=138851 RepID=UPI001AEC1D83|nr:hypothetical protein [Treponema parvum]QTQ16829.1 hypothetical protein HXT04_09055 [Treponema parvum]